jgi:betaine-aldehyde dehydrogenase
VLRSAAPEVKHVSLELGGKNPLIVLPDAPPEAAARLALIGLNLERTAGQSCGSTSRLYVHVSVLDEFVEALASMLESMVLGDPLSEDTSVGPLAYQAHHERVLGFLDSAPAEGARLVCGGGRPEDIERGYFVRPTLFDRVEDSMTIAREEIFGPVAAVLPWTDEDDVVRRANATPLGLTANVVTNDLAAASRLTRRLEAGFVWVNGKGERPFGAPFGGYKQSGLGEENSLGELLSYSRVKNVQLNPL